MRLGGNMYLKLAEGGLVKKMEVVKMEGYVKTEV